MLLKWSARPRVIEGFTVCIRLYGASEITSAWCETQRLHAGKECSDAGPCKLVASLQGPWSHSGSTACRRASRTVSSIGAAWQQSSPGLRAPANTTDRRHRLTRPRFRRARRPTYIFCLAAHEQISHLGLFSASDVWFSRPLVPGISTSTTTTTTTTFLWTFSSNVPGSSGSPRILLFQLFPKRISGISGISGTGLFRAQCPYRRRGLHARLCHAFLGRVTNCFCNFIVFCIIS